MSAAKPALEANNVERKWTVRLRAEWVIIGAIVSTLSAFAQETIVVTGRVFDQETQKPVVSANVILRGEKKGTITDSTGSFRLELAAQQKHILAFSHVAYRKETRELAPGASKEIEFRIYLVPEPIYMQEVVVYGNREAVLTKAAEKRAIHSIGGEEFEKLGEEDMERALIYFLPDVVNRLDKRMASNADDFTLYVNGDWKESLTCPILIRSPYGVCWFGSNWDGKRTLTHRGKQPDMDGALMSSHQECLFVAANSWSWWKRSRDKHSCRMTAAPMACGE
jgi:hypothetical protein